MRRQATAIMLSLLLAAAMLLAVGGGASTADPVQDKKSELERIKNEVQSIDAQLESVTEQYNLTNLRVGQTQARIAQKEREIAALTAELENRKDILGQRMREIYKSGNADILEVITECRTMDDLYTNLDRARRIGGGDVEIIASVLSARGQVEAARAELEAQRAELDAAVAQLQAQKSRIESELQRRRELMSGVEAEVNRLIAQEEANRAAVSTPRQTVSRPIPPPPPPPPYAPRVVQVAYQQLGKPYRYAGSGPDVFDCSGLVMYCYAQVGISLPHSSYMQARCGVPVSYSDLQPGDLVFFHGYGHVGMYIGNGQYIHAPRTGDVVRIADLGRRSDFCGAVRII
ncbi:MAG: C40 family peptidase [Actinobacteria bacterium]|nr:C40 family peptidase [Actinomycetota bacterium]